MAMYSCKKKSNMTQHSTKKFDDSPFLPTETGVRTSIKWSIQVSKLTFFQSQLESRLARFTRSENCDPLPQALAWKYVAYCRKNVPNISLSPEACQVIEFRFKYKK